MSDEMDPEVVADLKLRAYTEHDRSRTRGEGVYDWRAPEHVGAWPCRYPKCAQLVGIDADTMAQAAQFNGYLRARGEQPMDIGQIVMCPKHDAVFRQERSYRLYERVEKLREVIKKLKDLPNPRKATEPVAEAVNLRHPDIEGLLGALEARQGSGSKREKRSAF